MDTEYAFACPGRNRPPDEPPYRGVVTEAPSADTYAARDPAAAELGRTPPERRLLGVDAARGLALAGVVTMNWIAYFNLADWYDGAQIEPGHVLWPVLDPLGGPLSTRFAATFVLARRHRRVADDAARPAGHATRVRLGRDRWTLRRRGALLILVGLPFNWAWPGEILHFYGCYLVVASFVLAWRSRALLAAAAGVVAATAAFEAYLYQRIAVEGDLGLQWLFRPGTGSWHELVADLFVSGTHPLTPWLAFVFLGMCVGRLRLRDRRTAAWLVVGGLAALAGGYVLAALIEPLAASDWAWVASTDPLDRMPLHVVTAAGSAVAAVGLLLLAASAFPTSAAIRALAGLGQLTFTLYLAHGLLAAAVLRWLWDDAAVGLLGALALAAGFWACALVFSLALPAPATHAARPRWCCGAFGG